ncbi:hypothetical protein [Brevibacillus choshinensis]|uniref:hypothetical protein n=1 Tax=Brevibacillus choshinensis TaxID=54911 RepID=UPI002E1C8A57|nr:hypothetical protein [Brevibacillus choshinensis]
MSTSYSSICLDVMLGNKIIHDPATSGHSSHREGARPKQILGNVLLLTLLGRRGGMLD